MKARKPYDRPALRSYGDIRELTAVKTGGAADMAVLFQTRSGGESGGGSGGAYNGLS